MREEPLVRGSIDAMSTGSSCPICGGTQLKARFPFHEYTVLRCGTCGVEFLSPQPSDTVLAGIYTDDYFFGRDGAADQERYTALKQQSAARTLALLPPREPGATLVDIGCGVGDFIVVANRLGFRVSGVEFSPSSVKTARSRVAGEIVQGELANAAFADASFDVVTNSDVIEHTRDPLAFAREIRRILKPGGHAVISTPATDSWSARVMGSRWVEYKIEHLFYFDRPSLRTLLERAGFTQISIRPNVKVLSIGYIQEHFVKFPVMPWSTLVNLGAGALPEGLRHRAFPIVASGITAIAS